MTLQLLIDGTDYTSRWRPYESRWTLRGHMLESMQSEFVLDDEDGDLPIADVRPRKIVEVWEDASGAPVCLYRGRIASKTLGRGPLRVNPAMRWRLMVEDVNVEVRGIRIVSFDRDAELDTTRVEVLRLAYLNGASSLNPHARDSTSLGGTYIQTDSTTTVDPDHYTDTYPDQLLLQIAEDAGKQVFVYLEDDGTMELFFGTFGDSLALTSDIELNDDGSADGEDVFAPYYSEATAEHDGQRVITGGGIRYGPDDDYFGESDVNGTEATYDKWEEHLVNEYIDNETEADRHVTNVVHVRQAEQSYTAVIDMRAEQVHRIKAGMVVNHQQLSAAKTLGLQRASQVTYEPQHPDADGNTAYRVTIELGRPRARRSILNVRRRPTAAPIPRRPTQPTEACTRLYFTSAGTPLTASAGWDGGSADMVTLNLATTPSGSGGTAASWDAVNQAAAAFALIQGRITLSNAALLAAVQDGADFRIQARVGIRHGIGINEDAHREYLDGCIRVWRPSTASFIGTMLDVGDETSTIHAENDTAGTVENRHIAGSLTAVPSAVATDVLVVELGLQHDAPITGGAGGNVQTADDQASDLPEDDTTTTNGNAWLDICTGSAGDTTSPTVLPGEETAGDGTGSDDDEPTYVGPDHTHSHGLLADDAIHMHDADQIDGLDTSGGAVSVSDVLTAINFPIIAHRGDMNPVDGYPECTLPALREAARTAHGVEFDVLRDSEGTWQVIHDTTVDRTTDGTGAVSSKTTAQMAALNIDGGFGYDSGRHAGLGLTVPTLDEAIEVMLPYDPVLYFDLKESSDEAHEELAEYIVNNGLVSRSILLGLTVAGLEAAHAIAPALEMQIPAIIDDDPQLYDYIDRVLSEQAVVTNAAYVQARDPDPVDSYISADDHYGEDEQVYLAAMWERGVRAYLTNDLPNALAYRNSIVLGITGSGATASISIGPILVTSVPAGSPLIFADLLQNSDGTDLLYASEP